MVATIYIGAVVKCALRRAGDDKGQCILRPDPMYLRACWHPGPWVESVVETMLAAGRVAVPLDRVCGLS